MQGYSCNTETKNLILIINGWSMPNLIIEPLQQLFIKQNSLCEVINLSELPLIASATTISIDYNLFFTNIAKRLANKNLHIIGWSMGGNIANQLAQKFSSRVKSLTFISSNPCFVANSDWQDAMPFEVFTKFQNKFKANANIALLQFANLCTLGNSKQKNHALNMQQNLAKTPKQINKLEALLDILAKLDTRKLLHDFTKPVLHFFGSNDSLVPIATMQQINKLYPQHKTIAFNGGHSFFLDDFNEIFQKIYQFHQQSD